MRLILDLLQVQWNMSYLFPSLYQAFGQRGRWKKRARDERGLPLFSIVPTDREPGTGKVFSQGLVHTTLEEFENGDFTVKTRRLFSVHSTVEKFENATIIGQFGFVFDKTSVREITWLSRRQRFRKAPFSKCFPSTQKRKAGVFNFLRFEERFEKFRFRDGLVWTVGLTVEIKLRFQISPAQCGRCLSFEQIAFIIDYRFACLVDTVCFL